ncbi:MAG: RsmD family RNA methyltransferase [Deinococcus sp.]|nr:RsmD family RNA methyltransferase [Deinococcus sp.]
MIRLTGGSARGRLIRVPASARPTPSRLRVALFDLLGPVAGRTFLDLYAGSGAVGLEAASRGAVATCVERYPQALRLIRENAQRLGLKLEVVAADAQTSLSRLAGRQFEIVFIDPPYSQDSARAVQEVLERRLCSRVLVLQHLAQQAPVPGAKVRRYGSNTLSILEVAEAA